MGLYVLEGIQQQCRIVPNLLICYTDATKKKYFYSIVLKM